ncbi:phosphotransferase [Actinomycetaceae bacterium L2_0104]
MKPVPFAVMIDGREWRVSRVWPGRGSGAPVELAFEGALRGAYWNGIEMKAMEEGSDLLLPQLVEVLGKHGGEVVSHRPGRRAVVRTRANTYVKVVRPGRSGAILAGIERARPFAHTFRTPRVLGHDESTVTFSAVPGRSLHSGAHWSPVAWKLAWAGTLDAWSRATAFVAMDAPVHDATAEAVVLASWVSKVAAVEPDAAEEISRVAAVAMEALLALPTPSTVTPIHRDLHDKQLIWDPEAGPGMIDLDTVCRGDPAIDLGNLGAHVRLRHAQGIWDARQSDTVSALIEGEGRARGIPRAHIVAYERATLVRLACIYAFRPRWRHLTPILLNKARTP